MKVKRDGFISRRGFREFGVSVNQVDAWEENLVTSEEEVVEGVGGVVVWGEGVVEKGEKFRGAVLGHVGHVGYDGRVPLVILGSLLMLNLFIYPLIYPLIYICC
mmetsp:Transcript_6186/g.12280  ORF Transcript_6186/g.12280 Transcript_6186/m.12280 type:complete len:104 (-) Transcript_6186:18-329(-)